MRKRMEFAFYLMLFVLFSCLTVALVAVYQNGRVMIAHPPIHDNSIRKAVNEDVSLEEDGQQSQGENY